MVDTGRQNQSRLANLGNEEERKTGRKERQDNPVGLICRRGRLLHDLSSSNVPLLALLFVFPTWMAGSIDELSLRGCAGNTLALPPSHPLQIISKLAPYN